MPEFVRQSKFRHVYCKPVKHENCMSDIKVTEITWDSLFCAVNPKFIAFIHKGSGGPFLVIPVNKVGRIDKDYPFVDAHKAPCLEIAWSPFNDNVIASCSEDTTAKVWLIPEGGLRRTINEPAVELVGHQKRVNSIAWHPVANNLLLTAGGDNVLLLWNVGTGEALLEVAGHPDQIWSCAFNYDGSRFVTCCKDKKLRVFNAHSGEMLHEGMGHEGVKPQKAIFDRDGRVITTGFTKRSERMYALRAQEDLSTPIVQEELDTSNGVLFPFYDEDSGLLYLIGKGDCAIRYYEVNHEYPFIHYINTYTTSEPQRAIGFQSKRGVCSEENELNRIYKLTTKGVVDVLQFFVPRKSDLFQHDLYPDTRSTVPALTPEQFMEGKDAPPNLQPVNPAAAQAKPKLQVAKKANILSQLQPTAAAEPAAPLSYKEQASPQPSRPASSRRVVVDDDMGIVTASPSPSQSAASHRRSEPSAPSPRQAPPPEEDKPDPMVPRTQQPTNGSLSLDTSLLVPYPFSPADTALSAPSFPMSAAPSPALSTRSSTSDRSVKLRSRAERDVQGQMTAGQRRAAADLDRIKREKDRNADEAEPAYKPPPTRSSDRPGSRTSTAGVSMPDADAPVMMSDSGPSSMEELVGDLQKMKLILRQHERRIRLLEDQLADFQMSNTYNF